MTDYLDDRPNLSDARNVAAYDELPLWSSFAGALLLDEMPIGRGLRVLDVGFGTGFPLLELAGRLGQTCTLYGVDPWRQAIARAHAKRRVYGARNVVMIEGDAASMPFRDSAFDLVVSNLGVNNFDDAPAALRECCRVTAPSGALALTTNLQGHMQEFYDVFAATLRDLRLVAALDALAAHVEHRTTIERLSEALAIAGYSVRRTRESTVTLRFADGSALLRHYFIRLGFLGRWKQVVKDGDRQRVFQRLESNLNAVAIDRGELALTVPLAYVEAVPKRKSSSD
jgi:ubiquinone/menaquinone biosynthesis C-methylase UbiE